MIFRKQRRFTLASSLRNQNKVLLRKENIMKGKKLMPLTLLTAAAIAWNTAPAWSQSTGGSQSKRAGDSDTPVGEGRFGDPGKSGQGSGSTSPSARGQSNKDSSVGGSQSNRAGDSDTPIGQGRFGDPNKAGRSSRPMAEASGMGGQQDIRQAQEALKNQGHDPGPIDGVMGPQTRQALRAFQSSNGLKQTGMLDAETKQKLNIEDSSTRGSAPMGRGESSTRQQESSPMGR
jgi:Putative peptidoglycan binding domain